MIKPILSAAALSFALVSAAWALPAAPKTELPALNQSEIIQVGKKSHGHGHHGGKHYNKKHYKYYGGKHWKGGRYYHGGRYYAPWLCRWISADPAGVTSGTNLYAYVSNNPVIYTDPDGRAEKGWWATTISGVAQSLHSGAVLRFSAPQFGHVFISRLLSFFDSTGWLTYESSLRKIRGIELKALAYS